MKQKEIAIVGAGLVGSLLALYLAKRGHRISLFERRGDMRKETTDAGRSINLALSNRGIRALDEVGLAGAVKTAAIPMHGRIMHDLHGALSFLPYGKEGQFINSISRSGLNTVLMEAAEAAGATIHFNHRCVHVDLRDTSLTFEHASEARKFDGVIGADGAFSAVRGAMQLTDRFNFSQYYIEHGYKELSIPAGKNHSFLLEKNALHIWPRESFMMIALPNPDGTFTCTLFLPFEGDPSFRSLADEGKLKTFFKNTFPDAVALMPDLMQDYQVNPAASLVTIKCYPWVHKNTFLIGDAAHGIVPFYGQGMNAGFEDCRILDHLLTEYNDDWERALTEFQNLRKPDTDAIAGLALDNFIEMRDLVADREFLLRKKIEARLHELFPAKWIPLYSMVTFHDEIGYSEAQYVGLKQKKIMDEVLQKPEIEKNWQHLNFEEIIRRLENETGPVRTGSRPGEDGRVG